MSQIRSSIVPVAKTSRAERDFGLFRPATPPRKSEPFIPRRAAAVGLAVALFSVCYPLGAAAGAETVAGAMTVNGVRLEAAFVGAQEIDSVTEPGYLDVVIVLSNKPLAAEQMADQKTLEQLSFREGLMALQLILDPDCKVKSIAYYHPKFEVFLVNVGQHLWEPSAFDDVVAGRVRSDGKQSGYEQTWDFDFAFSTPIRLDPEALQSPEG